MPAVNFENPACSIKIADQKNQSTEEWALIHKGELAGIYGSVESAWNEAATRFHRRRCLVRQISTPPLTVGISAENLQATDTWMFMPIQKWIRLVARRLFPTSEMSF